MDRAVCHGIGSSGGWHSPCTDRGMRTERPRPFDPIETHGASTASRSDGREPVEQFLVGRLHRAFEIDASSQSDLEDQCVDGPEQGHVLVVTDSRPAAGDGSRGAGKIALDTVVESALREVSWAPTLDLDAEAKLRTELRDCVEACDERVTEARRPAGSPSLASGAAMTMAMVRWPTAFIVHAGNTRAYIVRDGEVDCVTTDHVVRERDVDASHGEAPAASRFGELLWNGIGGAGDVAPEIITERLEPGDHLLICSDGLARSVSDADIGEIVTGSPTAEEACNRLLVAARDNGAADPVTVALARIDEADVTASLSADAEATAEQERTRQRAAPDKLTSQSPRPGRDRDPEEQRPLRMSASGGSSVSAAG